MNTHLLSLLLSSFPKDFNEVLKYVKPTIGIKTVEIIQEGEVTSKFGGLPDIPNSFIWPSFQEKSLTFLCQVVLEEIKEYEPSHLLPKTGVLYFFVCTEIKDRFPEQIGEFKVIYEEAEKQSLHKAQLDGELTLTERAISFYQHYTFPSYQDYQMERLSEKGIELEEFLDEYQFEIREMLMGDVDIPNHQILGHPLALQGMVKPWWAVQYSKLPEPLSEKQEMKLYKMGEEFLLLFQFDLESEDQSLQEFLGDGMAYFGIHQNDLKIQDFNKALLVIQNT
ncbi:hypothetical protein OB69_11400 [Roseivirga seohaensis subsp. aquiponti]|uniref:DUF1963 domain-containing protein n=1 Tax=Roseivirga seohaensis subsp. aquiponti TaxID=1566026 RepID=A0A0L8AJG6_9BACT|nr:DUF1963 domain-containing protein [Roseivirga seohaensis]KOF02529.1 hypothetical protein OB69_11400 [Roseivirga seohaensis subsp. aquiponti]